MSSLLKNTASQKWSVFAFNLSTGAATTGDSANITGKIRKDYGTATAITDTNPTEVEDGYYEFDLTAGETNADVLDILPQSSTGSVQVIGVPARIFTVNSSNLLTEASIVDAVWDELATSHETTDTTGRKLKILAQAAAAITGDDASNSSSYLSASEFLKRVDWNIVAELVTDDNVTGTETKVTEGSLSTNARVQAALDDASGIVEAAIIAQGRYTVANIAAADGVALAFIYRLIARLTVLLLWERRPKTSMPEPYYRGEVLGLLEQIKSGDITLAI